MLDYYSLLDNSIITVLPKDTNCLDNDYLNFISKINQNSKEKNKIKQKMKLILLFDENYYYNKGIQEVKYQNINEIEFFFKDYNIEKKIY